MFARLKGQSGCEQQLRNNLTAEQTDQELQLQQLESQLHCVQSELAASEAGSELLQQQLADEREAAGRESKQLELTLMAAFDEELEVQREAHHAGRCTASNRP